MTKIEMLQCASVAIVCAFAVVMLARGFWFNACGQLDKAAASYFWSITLSYAGFVQLAAFTTWDRWIGQ